MPILFADLLRSLIWSRLYSILRRNPQKILVLSFSQTNILLLLRALFSRWRFLIRTWGHICVLSFCLRLWLSFFKFYFVRNFRFANAFIFNLVIRFALGKSIGGWRFGGFLIIVLSEPLLLFVTIVELVIVFLSFASINWLFSFLKVAFVLIIFNFFNIFTLVQFKGFWFFISDFMLVLLDLVQELDLFLAGFLHRLDIEIGVLWRCRSLLGLWQLPGRNYGS